MQRWGRAELPIPPAAPCLFIRMLDRNPMLQGRLQRTAADQPLLQLMHQSMPCSLIS